MKQRVVSDEDGADIDVKDGLTSKLNSFDFIQEVVAAVWYLQP